MSSAGLDNFSQYLNVGTPALGVKMKLAWTDFEPPLLDPDRMVKILKNGIIENIAILHLINANLVPSSYDSKMIIINYTNNIMSKSAMMENLTFGIEKV